MSVGEPDCCGVLEIYPVKNYREVTHGNVIKLLGAKYDRIDLDASRSKPTGVTLPINIIKQRSLALISAVVNQSSCLLTTAIQNPFFRKKTAH